MPTTVRALKRRRYLRRAVQSDISPKIHQALHFASSSEFRTHDCLLRVETHSNQATPQNGRGETSLEGRPREAVGE